MPRNTIQPSNLELQALTVLWSRGPSTVAEVHGALPDARERAYTTVLTVMQNLERKNLVRHEVVGRAHVFEAGCDRGVVVGRAVAELVTNVFGGRLAEAVLAILSTGGLSPEEKTRIEQQLKQHRTMPAKKATKKVAKKVAKKAPAKKAPAKAPAKKAPAKKAPAKKVAKKAPAKKAPAKKAPAKKAPAKKAPAKKAVAKKAAAKKAPAKKAAAKKVVAKKAVARKAVAKKVVAKKAPAKKAAKKG
ncbi:MAG: BlaI/MecI/CopY family transcriptional regulator [Akkermansiaceae bacterium]|nr:BlaI/MecI/CopY family transcriptional regulator [Akkermansiaceae bacterium]MCF7732468.1 BlaI/MecI/CopY family transcriptional regulator [Akkermansiaceae bacterium]